MIVKRSDMFISIAVCASLMLVYLITGNAVFIAIMPLFGLAQGIVITILRT